MRKNERTELRSNWRDPNNNCGLPENHHRKVRASRQPRPQKAGAVRITQVPPTRRSSKYRELFPVLSQEEIKRRAYTF